MPKGAAVDVMKIPTVLQGVEGISHRTWETVYLFLAGLMGRRTSRLGSYCFSLFGDLIITFSNLRRILLIK